MSSVANLRVPSSIPALGMFAFLHVLASVQRMTAATGAAAPTHLPSDELGFRATPLYKKRPSCGNNTGLRGVKTNKGVISVAFKLGLYVVACGLWFTLMLGSYTCLPTPIAGMS